MDDVEKTFSKTGGRQHTARVPHAARQAIFNGTQPQMTSWRPNQITTTTQRRYSAVSKLLNRWTPINNKERNFKKLLKTVYLYYFAAFDYPSWPQYASWVLSFPSSPFSLCTHGISAVFTRFLVQILFGAISYKSELGGVDLHPFSRREQTRL